MGGFIIRRLLQSVLVIFGVLVLVFAIMQLTGDPATLMLPDNASPQDLEFMRKKLGTDKPLHLQFIRFLFGDRVLGEKVEERVIEHQFMSSVVAGRIREYRGVIMGDFGDSIRFIDQPALPIVLERFPLTLYLMVVAFAYSAGLSLILGIVSAVYRNTLFDQALRSLAILGQSIPNFWLGMMLILVFAVWLGLLPAMGSGGLEHVILPAITLGSAPLGRNVRLVRSCMLDVLGADYIRTARAKGLSELAVVVGHALKNAAIPVVTIWGLDIGLFFGGAVVTESIFGWPGMGSLIIQSVYKRDFPVVQAAVFFVALVFVTVNLLVDLMYAWLDPRVRLAH